ncbi:hypothetical protein M3Y97_00120900 [Aphelenchoides bicaudatus]|nr:hypothetical protein M3Y97_00120900 [Aphelenchoides bicaudatus]
MYQAYTSEDVITRLPSLDPTCFASSVAKSKLFIGTKQGHLLGIDQKSNDKRTFASVVHRSFEKKAITDLQPDNRLFVLICVRKRLYLLKWLVNEFDEVRLEFTPAYLADNCSLLTWCGFHSVYFAVKNEYYYVRIFEEQLSSSSSGNVDDLGAIRSITSTTDSPSIVELNEMNLVGVSKGNQIEFYNEHGNRVPHLSNYRFSDTPIALAYDAPYLIGILPKGLVEVRSVQPEMFIQKLSFNKAAYIHRGAAGFVFIASDHAVWKLDSRPLAKGNVKLLADEKHFELAVNLAQHTPQFDKEEMKTLKRKLATNLFLQREFEKCFNIHLEIDTGSTLVACPNIHTPNWKTFEHNGMELPQNELKQALNPLADFLSEKRNEFGRKLDQHQKAKHDQRKDLLLGSKEVQRLREGLELVQTLMVKCYLKTRPMLVASLLKVSGNICIFEEIEQDLKDANLSSELLILYKRKEKHKEALALLKEQAHSEKGPLSGLDQIVEYLQELSEEHLPLIFEHAKWILAEDFNRGVEIFTGENTQRWECEEVLHFLRHECREAIIPYLEDVINRCGEQRPKIHETLAEQYIVMVKKLMKDYVHVLSDNENTTKGGEEHGELGVYRQKLMNFLRESHFYGAQKILQLLDDHLIEEKAIVFGRLKRHREALLIYTQILADFEAAERHCLTAYREDDPVDSEVFFEFYQVCIDPNTDLPKDALNSRLLVKKPRSNVNEALKAITLIPSDAPLNKVFVALEAVLETTKNRVSSSGILLAISNLARERASKELDKQESLKILIDSKRRVAFVRYPNGQIAHFFCHRNSDDKK